jgi:hypothetical protein
MARDTGHTAELPPSNLGNNNVIIPADYDRLSGSTAFYGVTRVKVVKV